MNLISVDITRLGPLELGEPATLIGKDGDGAIRIEEFAKWAGTISYEVMTTVGRLNPREWITGRITLPSGK
jgi:alanine racemase